uniref:MORN repeat-containing protein 5 n=1 Tax=Myxine glutinosa TaxID=7769 RepID=UPI0035900750
MEYTGSSYKGDYVNGRIEGRGHYTLPTGTRYEGELLDGLFHGTGVLCFPHGDRFEATWTHGVANDGVHIFADGLVYDESDWTYCDGRQRQYYSEICDGFKPAGLTQLTNSPSVREIPEGCYECQDGFYDPKTREVSTYEHKLLRYAGETEHRWILRFCRKSWDDIVPFKPLQTSIQEVRDLEAVLTKLE